jgi:hypothetical protein
MGRAPAGRYDLLATTALLALLAWGLYASVKWDESTDAFDATLLGCVAIGGVGAAAWGVLRLIDKLIDR